MTAAAKTRYSTVAILLHWAIAALIIANVGLAWYSETLKGEDAINLIQWHKTLGISVLVLSVIRLGWRLVNPPPPLSGHLKPWERWLAHVVHWGLYVVMIGLPLSGWAMVSASRLIEIYPINMFGLFHWPAIAPLGNLPADQMKATHETFEQIHGLLAKAIVYVLVPLHVLGALKHQFLDRDGELGKMIPGLGRKEIAQ